MSKMHNEENKHSRPRQGGGPRHGMRAPGEKAKNFKASISKLLKYSEKWLPFIFIALILSAAGTLLSVLGPRQIQKITQYIKEGLFTTIDLDAVKSVALLLISMYALGVIFNYLQSFIMATITQKLSKNLRTDISHKINRLPLKYFDKSTFGDTLSRVTNDVDTIGHTMNQSVGSLVSSITMLVGSVVMMFITNWIMAVSAIAASLLGFTLMITIITKSQKFFIQQQQGLGEINGHIEEIYSGHNIVKAYNSEKNSKKVFHKMNTNLYQSAWKSQFFSSIMMPLMSFVGNFGYVVVCIVGSILTINNVIDISVIIAFMIYVNLFNQPLSSLAQSATALQSAAAASERVFEFLEEPEMSKDNASHEDLTNVKGNVEFKNVVFGYDEGKIIINNFSAEVKAGQKIAIVGPTGAGKTTIVNLLMRFYELNSGEIIIDGVKISEMNRHQLRDMFCMVLQDTWLFEGTVRENIVYSMENVSHEVVEKASKAVGIDHFIRTLPNGYDTVLSDKATISAGQRQLITIARALVKDAPLLILDEATSSIDTRTELLIQNAMDKLMKGRTSFVIAHRLSTIKNADLILVMKDGNVIESGTHEKLLEEKGFYADLYNSQFESE